jgi:hypothetical protein
MNAKPMNGSNAISRSLNRYLTYLAFSFLCLSERLGIRYQSHMPLLFSGYSIVCYWWIFKSTTDLDKTIT